MPRARSVCNQVGCPELVRLEDRGRCKAHQAPRDQQHRGYSRAAHRTRFRPRVLARDPICRLCHRAPSEVADHWPLSRRELVAKGLDPDDPKAGRGLCRSCDGRQTATRQPGGWHAEQRNRR